jgi:hypothetical protein
MELIRVSAMAWERGKQRKKGKAQSRWGEVGTRETRSALCVNHVTKHQAAPSQKHPFSFSKCEQKR